MKRFLLLLALAACAPTALANDDVSKVNGSIHTDAGASYRDLETVNGSIHLAAGVQARVEPFIADMAQAYAWADVVVCRAGALTLAELCAVGVGSVLVPFPQAVDDHQTRNAEYLVERGAARLLPQSAQLPAHLHAVLAELSVDAAQRLSMARAARALARPDAAQRVADAVFATLSQEAK